MGELTGQPLEDFDLAIPLGSRQQFVRLLLVDDVDARSLPADQFADPVGGQGSRRLGDAIGSDDPAEIQRVIPQDLLPDRHRALRLSGRSPDFGLAGQRPQPLRDREFGGGGPLEKGSRLAPLSADTGAVR